MILCYTKREMKHLHTFVAITILAGFGYSQCTGGLFALPQALAASSDMFDETILMSFSPIECETVIESSANSDIQTAEKSGCGDAGSCLEQAERGNVRTVAAVEDSGSRSLEIIPALLSLIPTIEPQSNSAEHARAGPLYAQASLYAHITVMRL